jgi:diguanylate cyclase (GGDEF)-like protein
VIVITVGLSVVGMLPYQRRMVLDRMRTEAQDVATSIDQVVASAIVSEDYGAVVEHCMRVVKDSSSILYVVITRTDGFSLVHSKKGWRQENLKGMWTPQDGGSSKGSFLYSQPAKQEVFHFSYPFRYSGIDWGWIHIGLSLTRYRTETRQLYRRTLALAALCVAFSLGMSLAFARTLTRPIHRLHQVTRRVALGDMDARVTILNGDELGSLASSFNHMAESLQLARRELEDRVRERTAELTAANQALQREIAERTRAEERLNYLAFYDGLTGLPNRFLFYDRLRQALAYSARDADYCLAVGILDLDRFKDVNDLLGHEVGDQLLKEVAARIRECIRDSDTVARMGGDEFFLLFPGVRGPEDAKAVVDRILSAFASPFLTRDERAAGIGVPALQAPAGEMCYVCPSIGLALAPQDGSDPDMLVRHADLALYRAKAEGGNGWSLFAAEMGTAMAERGLMRTHLRRAIEQRELQIHYQPQYEVSTGRLVGAEALVRWHHPESGMIPPREFIPVAEEMGLLETMDLWVMKTACRQAKVWRESGLADLKIAVNVSSRLFQRQDLPETVMQILREAGLPPQALEIEITEAATMQDWQHTRRVLHQLSAGGLRTPPVYASTAFASPSTISAPGSAPSATSNTSPSTPSR